AHVPGRERRERQPVDSYFMNDADLFFVVPTYRLRDVGETIKQYDEHFWRNGHSVRLLVLDDSSPANQEKYYPILEQTRTHNDLFYVGPKEKGHFLAFLNERLRDRKLEPLIKNLFRPSYGGNRNCTLMYSLGGIMLSSDDDMRPYALVEDSPESLGEDEVCHGRLYKAGQNGYTRKSFDFVASFLDVLGKPAAQVPGNYERGELLIDTATDLETNASKGLARDNSLMLQHGPVPDNAIVKMAQTFRSGTNDIDALDYVDMFLADEQQTTLDELSEFYVLVNFRPVLTKKNWRMDSGVAGYDNTFGLPPFFPTWLRFEDYIYRLWIQQDGVCSAHVDAAQNHTKSNYMRNPPAAEIFNEEISNLLKRKIRSTLTRLDDLSIAFDYENEVTAQDAEEILTKITALHRRALQAAKTEKNPARAQSLQLFGANLEKAFYGFEPDFFQQNLLRIVDDAISIIKGSIELWPSLVEICYFHKNRKGLPQVRVKNRKRRATRKARQNGDLPFSSVAGLSNDP
ncbi:MAG: hypothetical protein QOF64_2886, partial [Candidatus Binatota bacterium]|nr:hypothetical protein [Candidatus Binatota bacterium]